ncbi:hypothetical protein Goari_004462, partial [Gossypium aridum]|nr:hypothetical protein [Gossypium aridum]
MKEWLMTSGTRVKSGGKGIGSLSFMVLRWGSAFANYPFLLLMLMIAERGYITPMNNEENLIHALKECLKVRETLIIGGLKNRLLDGNYVRCIDWLEDILRELDSKAAADSFTLLWNCWNNRNKMVFQGKDNPTMVMWER